MGLVLNVILHVVGLVLILLDFAIYLLMLGPFFTVYKWLTSRSTFAAPHSEAAINGSMPPSKVWRSVEAIAQGKLTETTEASVLTAYDALAASYKKNAKKNAQGIRPLLSWKKDDGFKFPAKVKKKESAGPWRCALIFLT